MSEWKTVKVGDVFSATKGYGLSKDKILVGGAYECILYGDLYTQYSEVIKEVVNSTNHKDGVLSQLDDILIPCSTTTTAIDLATASVIKKKDVQLGGDITILRPKKGNLTDGEFFAYYLTNKKKNELAEYGQGITIVHLYYKHFKDMEIDLPPLVEQQRIARVLGDIDDEIATLEELVAKKRLVKTAVMQQLLTGKVRLTADGRAVTGAEIERERRLGHLQPWRRVKLGEIIVPVAEKIKCSNLSFGGYITTENMGHGIVNFGVVPPRGINVQRFRAGDVLISNIRPYLKKYWAADFDGGASNDVLVFRADSRVLRGELLPRYLGQDRFFEYCTLHSNGTKMPRGDKQKIAEYEFDIPTDKSEQTRIADTLADIDDDIAVHETLISKKRRVRTGVMQQLLTGKTRLLEAA